MSLYKEPIIRSPFTDLTGNLGHHQHFSRCADFEMAMMECMEAYGMPRAEVKCKDLIDDFKECHSQRKQIMRENAMRMERHKQLLKGERSWKEHYAPAPKPDSY
ncbi:NADH dehydrogenase [ubiquinone] iron-sulfur protein 5 [Macrosteles quadrilineatus]|uniref:NADH dehydrogenase [ubiquinone] iron-sulfur protein 5 n=1 Tax=Macrosteles quadrilineatus TaxID=74068 RepID=UPI0023E1D280|nr:NADH dehydrogenase [ubiquinone] iron-sulfur protein 5 [Macrosteles quadrilineatus]